VVFCGIGHVKVVWLSDLHFVPDGQIEYNGVKSILDGLDLPYFVMMGNHDARAPLRAVFDLPSNAMADFAQYVIETDMGRFVCLDTKADGTDSGYLCHERLAWLDQVLGETDGKPVYLFLHHPPVSLGLPPFDEIGLRNRVDLMEIVSGHDCVAHIFAGHVHQQITGQVRGIPFEIAGSVIYQSPPLYPSWDWEGFGPSAAAPTYGVINLNQTDVVVHAVPFCDAEFGRVA